MSTALNSFWFDFKSAGLMTGGDMSGQPTFAEQLEECFGPARALDLSGFDELIQELELWLDEDGDDDLPVSG